ncbi:MAG: hypothetical protein IPK07_13275 [Deltaproteobacteria bacterium]|nr:hypothetical protein [Deltaproteobacteria bacterium]
MAAPDPIRRALWSSYFPSWGGTLRPGARGTREDCLPLRLGEVLDLLVSERHRQLRANVPRAVLGAALWNLLGRADEMDSNLKPLFEFAVKDSLGFESLDLARRSFGDRTNGAVPPLGTGALKKVLESSLLVTDDGLTCTATAELLVDRKFEEIKVVATDLDEAAGRARLFWEFADSPDERSASQVQAVRSRSICRTGRPLSWRCVLGSDSLSPVPARTSNWIRIRPAGGTHRSPRTAA